MSTRRRRKGISVLLACFYIWVFLFPVHVISFSVGATSSTAPTQAQATQAPAIPHECQLCSTSFTSRNALFRHLRECAATAEDTAGKDRNFELSTRLSLVVRFAYFIETNENHNQNTTLIRKEQVPEAREIGDMIQKMIAKGLRDIFGGGSVSSWTQTSVARQRHRALSQENGLSSAADVLALNVRVPPGQLEDPAKCSGQLLEAINQHLLGGAATASNHSHAIRILDLKTLQSSDRTFHAEQDCTQRVYHYLLPLSWLPDGEKLESWWLQHDPPHPEPPSDVLRRLREALKNAESKTVPNRRVRRRAGKMSATTSNYVSTNRIGAFANKEKNPWHNFADRGLRGDASPNQEPVWRILDKARILGIDTDPVRNEVFAILEFRGDDFVLGQIRSIVGTALAITRGWLPANTFQVALSKDVFLETPTAPEGRLYNAGSRYHFHEKAYLPFGAHLDNSLKWVQKNLLRQLSLDSVAVREKRWLCDLETVVAPRVALAMKVEQNVRENRKRKDTSKPNSHEALPLLEESIKDNAVVLRSYQQTLSLLRQVVESESWPETSVARSGVIRDAVNDNYNEQAEVGKSGSFTVFNTKVADNHLLHQGELPMGNTAFPMLVEAVFELEAALSSLNLRMANVDGSLHQQTTQESTPRRRAASLCCAINCNAQFRPHVDSGRGAGQTLSMIVGLGDYSGGELFVEGTSHDIRYKALEFDGWSSRHWTNYYEGERFSLVWFSPEAKAR